MWEKIVLNKGKKYVLLLCEKEGRRYCLVAEQGATNDYTIYSTEIIPNDLIENFESEEVSDNYKTSDGQKFFFGSHGEWVTESEYIEMRLNDHYGPITPYGDRIFHIHFEQTYSPKFYRKILKAILDENESVYCLIPEKCPVPYVCLQGDSNGEISGKVQIYKSESMKFFDFEEAKIKQFRLPNGEIVVVTSPQNGIPVKLQFLLINLRTFEILKTKYGYKCQQS